MIHDGKIRVNGAVKKPSYKIQPDDVITGCISQNDSITRAVPEKIGISVQHEDPHILVIDKAPGMVVHPGAGNETGTLVNAILAHAPEISQTGSDKLRPGIVHRLDKDTSGLIVVAKTQKSLEFLQREFKYRRVEKRYLALVQGNTLDETGEIDLPIGRHPMKRKQMAVDLKNGRPAVSRWHVRERFNEVSLVDIKLLTGRTHQIRLHFYAIGHPLLGDPVYQYRRNRKKKGTRQMLHAYFLSFRHPYSGQQVSFQNEPCLDFMHQLKRLRNK